MSSDDFTSGSIHGSANGKVSARNFSDTLFRNGQVIIPKSILSHGNLRHDTSEVSFDTTTVNAASLSSVSNDPIDSDSQKHSNTMYGSQKHLIPSTTGSQRDVGVDGQSFRSENPVSNSSKISITVYGPGDVASVEEDETDDDFSESEDDFQEPYAVIEVSTNTDAETTNQGTDPVTLENFYEGYAPPMIESSTLDESIVYDEYGNPISVYVGQVDEYSQVPEYGEDYLEVPEYDLPPEDDMEEYCHIRDSIDEFGSLDEGCDCTDCAADDMAITTNWDFLAAVLIPKHEYALSFVAASILMIALCLITWLNSIIGQYWRPKPKCIRWFGRSNEVW